MATINRLILLLVWFQILTVCLCEKKEKVMFDDKLEEIRTELIKSIGVDCGVYDIQTGNRFGDIVISIHCVTDSDRARIEKKYPNPYKGVILHFTSPIWGIGGLLPEKYKFIEKLRQIREYNVYGSPENNKLRELQEQITIEEKTLWNSWNDSVKKDFLSSWIKKERKRIPQYGNCADKFILQ